MKISLITPKSQNVEPWVPEFRRQGVEVLKNTVSKDCDFIVCTGQARLNQWKDFHKKHPNIPMVNYVWDFYEWVWKSPRGYDWHGYGEYLKKCKELWCPSQEVKTRMEEYFKLGSQCQIIPTWARFFSVDDSKICDKRYVYNPLRIIPDRNVGWIEKVCKELKIPLVQSKHKLSEAQFQKTIVECSFMVCDYYEASTGGLTLLEGYYHGKPCIISDSPYMGAKDYLGDKAIYFKHNDIDDLKRVVKNLWENPKSFDLEKTRKAFTHLTLEGMVKQMIERLHVLK